MNVPDLISKSIFHLFNNVLILPVGCLHSSAKTSYQDHVQQMLVQPEVFDFPSASLTWISASKTERSACRIASERCDPIYFVSVLHLLHILGEMEMWKLTRIRQDGVRLWQELVTADSLVSFSASVGESQGIS